MIKTEEILTMLKILVAVAYLIENVSWEILWKFSHFPIPAECRLPLNISLSLILIITSVTVCQTKLQHLWNVPGGFLSYKKYFKNVQENSLLS